MAWDWACRCLRVCMCSRLHFAHLACRFAFCEAAESTQMCPPGMNTNDACLPEDHSCYRCPSHRDCYTVCTEEQWGSWITVERSPYNSKAFCERFPRLTINQAPPPDGWTYLAQTGKADVARANFDTIFSSVITIFQILTGMPP
jgi:hypothetical protein